MLYQSLEASLSEETGSDTFSLIAMNGEQFNLPKTAAKRAKVVELALQNGVIRV
jgi:hypothetical protein